MPVKPAGPTEITEGAEETPDKGEHINNYITQWPYSGVFFSEGGLPQTLHS